MKYLFTTVAMPHEKTDKKFMGFYNPGVVPPVVVDSNGIDGAIGTYFEKIKPYAHVYNSSPTTYDWKAMYAVHHDVMRQSGIVAKAFVQCGSGGWVDLWITIQACG